MGWGVVAKMHYEWERRDSIMNEINGRINHINFTALNTLQNKKEVDKCHWSDKFKDPLDSNYPASLKHMIVLLVFYKTMFVILNAKAWEIKGVHVRVPSNKILVRLDNTWIIERRDIEPSVDSLHAWGKLRVVFRIVFICHCLFRSRNTFSNFQSTVNPFPFTLHS